MANQALERDLALRKAVEESLRASQLRFRATFEQAAVGIADVRTTGRFLRVNDKLCEITGFARADLLERTCTQITVPEDRPRADTMWLGLLNGRAAGRPIELRLLRGDGGCSRRTSCLPWRESTPSSRPSCSPVARWCTSTAMMHRTPASSQHSRTPRTCTSAQWRDTSLHRQLCAGDDARSRNAGSRSLPAQPPAG